MRERILYGMLGMDPHSTKSIAKRTMQRCPKCGTYQLVGDEPQKCMNEKCRAELVREDFSSTARTTMLMASK